MSAEVRDHIVDRFLFFLGILFRSDRLEESFEKGPATKNDDRRMEIQSRSSFDLRAKRLRNSDGVRSFWPTLIGIPAFKDRDKPLKLFRFVVQIRNRNSI